MLYFYKQHSLVQPEELHLNGDGVYFNIFTEDSRGEDTTGTLKNIGDDTVLYASIQNAGKNRYFQLITICISYIHAFSAFCPIEPSGKKMELNNVCILYLFL